MTSIPPRSTWRCAAVLAGIAAVVSCPACERSSPPPTTGLASQAEPVIQVETTPLQLGTIPQRLSAPGSLTARRVSRIGAELHGRIEEVYVLEGDRVESGAPLFRIDATPYEMAVREATAGLDLARAERQQLEADLARARELEQKRVIAEQDIERLSTSLAVARARERQASEAVALARHNLERTVVRAPYAGSVAERLADEGTTALVQPQTIVVILQETSELEARASIPESQLALVQVGNRALVHVEGLAAPIETRVSAVGDTIEPATRTYLVKMPVPNPEHQLKAGIFAHVEILPEARSDVIVVPREALRTEEGRTRLLVIRDGRAEAIPVEVGVVGEQQVEILTGAEIGERVIVGEAARTIAPGMPVRDGARAVEPPA